MAYAKFCQRMWTKDVSTLSEVTRRDTLRAWGKADRRVTFDRAV